MRIVGMPTVTQTVVPISTSSFQVTREVLFGEDKKPPLSRRIAKGGLITGIVGALTAGGGYLQWLGCQVTQVCTPETLKGIYQAMGLGGLAMVGGFLTAILALGAGNNNDQNPPNGTKRNDPPPM